MMIISIVFGLLDIDVVIVCLFCNVVDMGDLLKFYYGSEIVIMYNNLIRDYLVIVVEFVKVVKVGN